MKKDIKDLACPKCGATSDIWLYTVEYRVNEVRGVSSRDGYIEYEDCDIANVKHIGRALEGLGASMPPNFLAHEPDKVLNSACHVWLHDRSLYITDEAKLINELQERLMLSESSAEELVAKYRQGKEDTIADIVLRCSAAQFNEKQKDRLAAEVRALIPLDESKALALVDKYLESDASDKDDATGAGIVRWAIAR